jgi:hypothetical protein
MSLPYAIGMLVITVHLAWQTRRIDLARPELSLRLFLANILTGPSGLHALIGTWRASPSSRCAVSSQIAVPFVRADLRSAPNFADDADHQDGDQLLDRVLQSE